MKGRRLASYLVMASLLWVPAILVVYPPQAPGTYFDLTRPVVIEAFFVGVVVLFFSYLLYQVFRYYLMTDARDLDSSLQESIEAQKSS